MDCCCCHSFFVMFAFFGSFFCAFLLFGLSALVVVCWGWVGGQQTTTIADRFEMWGVGDMNSSFIVECRGCC